MSFRPPFFLVLLFLGGCMGSSPPAEPSVEPPMPTPEAGATLGKRLAFEFSEGNFTAVIPYKADAETTVIGGNLSMSGPKWKSILLLQVNEDPATGFWYLSTFQEYQARAKRFVENSMTGERRVECLDGSTTDPCPLDATKRAGGNQTGALFVGNSFPAGRGYFLLHGSTNGTFDIQVDFDEDILLGAAVLQPDSGYVVTWDQFRTRFANVTLCGDTFACGALIDGTFDVQEAAGNSPWAFSKLTAVVGPGAFWNVCVETSAPTPDCVMDARPCGVGLQCISRTDMHRGHESFTWRVNAYGSGPEAFPVSFFVFFGNIFPFNLPAEHPFR